MSLTFSILRHRHKATSKRTITPAHTVFLVEGDWDDYSFKTSFQVLYPLKDGKSLDLGTIKLGYAGQEPGWTGDSMDSDFTALKPGWFSLGQDVEYYESIRNELSEDDANILLSALRDVVHAEINLKSLSNEPVFEKSLMRGVSPSVVYGQYQRVLRGEVALTEYRFAYRDPGTHQGNDLYLKFEVEPGSKPPTNVHVLIGRNGAGKTTMFNNMIGTLIPSARINGNGGEFYEIGAFNTTGLPADYFSSVVSVSFSAFDPFPPPRDQTDRTQGLAYFYVGMKKKRAGAGNSVTAPKSDRELVEDFIESFEICMSQPAKRARWKAALERLETGGAMAEFPLHRLANMSKEEDPIGKAREFASRMSSGQAIVLLTITKLVETVEEKTLVLIDEPESHLHPPLLSAFTRALSDLLHNRNGVAIVATHSPVVAQEVPKSCVWVLTRHNTQRRAGRPLRETFGENVGILTRDIFRLEVTESGFHAMLKKSVDQGGTFESIMNEYGDQLGLEAQAILRSLIASRGTPAPGHVR